jgi:hypothetical protein
MLVVSDIESMFVPLRAGLFVDPHVSRYVTLSNRDILLGAIILILPGI